MKQSKPSIAKRVGIGCLLLIIILSLISFAVAFVVAGKMIKSSIGQGFFKQMIEEKTGVKIENGKNGNGMAITDKKTGESLTIGEGKIPANFPKDFPLYPGATPGGSAVGSEKATGKGFWLLLESKDALSKVVSYYDEQMEGKGWTVEETNTLGDGSMYRVKKEKLIGTLILSWDKKDAKTTILITLEPTNEGNPEPQEVAPEGAEPAEDLEL